MDDSYNRFDDAESGVVEWIHLKIQTRRAYNKSAYRFREDEEEEEEEREGVSCKATTMSASQRTPLQRFCSICLEEIQDYEKVFVLACHHGYHAPCLGAWEKTGATTCPYCRTPFTS